MALEGPHVQRSYTSVIDNATAVDILMVWYQSRYIYIYVDLVRGPVTTWVSSCRQSLWLPILPLVAQFAKPQIQVFRMISKVTLRATIGPSTELKGLL